jgi:hypothetical protein
MVLDVSVHGQFAPLYGQQECVVEEATHLMVARKEKKGWKAWDMT